VASITLNIPDDLSEQLTQLGDRLPDVLRQCVQPTALPAHVYRHILDFLTSQPTPDQIAAFRPLPEMQERLHTLLTKSQSNSLTPAETQELDEYEQIEHLVIMLKLGNLPFLTSPTAA